MITSTALEARIYDMIAPSLEALGYRIVQLKLMENQKRRVLSIIAERLDDELMTIEDCEQISTTSSALLDVEDPIQFAYHLEVSSPGLERPLTRLEDFTTYQGSEAHIEMVMPVDGRKRFRATIEASDGDLVTIAFEKKTLGLKFSQMKSAKLALSEAVFRELLKSDEDLPSNGRFKKKKKSGSEKQVKKDHKKKSTNSMQ